MKTAIVILNWNGKKWLKAFLPQLLKYSEQADIYVIDNASTDDDVEFLSTNFPSVKIVQNAQNYGFAGGYNAGLKHIKADIFCLLNSDVEVSEGWLPPVLYLFNQDETLAAVQPKILDYNQKDQFEYAGAAGGFLDNLGYPFCRGRIFWTLEKDQYQYNDVLPIFWASGACLFIRSEVFWKAGGFDSDFFAHMEEIDLCWRLQNLGYTILYCGKSTVYHVGGGTLQKNSPRKTYLNFRNSLFMLEKNLPLYKVFPVIFARLVLDGITAIVFWRYEGFGHLKAIFFAHMDFYKKFGHFWRKRQKTQRKFWAKRLVPFQYFILGKKYMKDLF
uniref:glycosyltransferase family 2 protein n=1 Tax=Ornithobacterium rhinotracheale TaxID=28251 RepID=UPI0039A4032E